MQKIISLNVSHKLYNALSLPIHFLAMLVLSLCVCVWMCVLCEFAGYLCICMPV